MRPRFQADADFNQKIVRGIRSREPAVDFQIAELGGMIGVPDHEVLVKAAGFGRQSSPGLILVPQDLDIGAAIEGLLLIWAASEAGEWRDRI